MELYNAFSLERTTIMTFIFKNLLKVGLSVKIQGSHQRKHAESLRRFLARLCVFKTYLVTDLHGEQALCEDKYLQDRDKHWSHYESFQTWITKPLDFECELQEAEKGNPN